MTNFDSLHHFPKKLPRLEYKGVVFIDRDGVIWEEQPVGVPFTDYPFYSGVNAGIKKLNGREVYTVVVNNQARVARGQLTEKEAQNSNLVLARRLKEEGSYLDLYLYCPHSKFADMVPFRIDCPWRKPGSGMLDFVQRHLKIDLKKSFLIGDQARDFLAARRVGVKSIGVSTGKSGHDEIFQAEPDFWKKDLRQAVDFILETGGV